MKVVEERLLKESEVCELVGISSSTLRRLVAAKLFPRPIRVGLRAVRWRQAEVLAWMESRPPATVYNLG